MVNSFRPLACPNCCVAYSAIPLIGAFTFSSPSIFLCSFSSKSACHVLPEAFPRAMKAAAQACSCSCACAVVLACRSLEAGGEEAAQGPARGGVPRMARHPAWR